MAAPSTTNATPTTVRVVPITRGRVTDSNRLRVKWAMASTKRDWVARVGLTTVTGARLRAWNRDTLATPWQTPARMHIKMERGGTPRKLLMALGSVKARSMTTPITMVYAEVTRGDGQQISEDVGTTGSL